MANLVYLGICGSLRQKSRNMGLLRKAKELMPESAKLEIVDIGDIPFYNADIEKPDSVKELVERGNAATGWVFASPEYNYSLAPALKNAIDWLSREPGIAPFYGKPGAIMGAAGQMGSVRSQNHLRQVCVYLNLLLLDKPDIFSNAFSSEFSENGDVVSEGLAKRVGALMQALVDWTKILQKGRTE